MIYTVIIGLFVIATVLYYIFCFLEIFEVIKFTGPKTTIRFPQMLIPFYYILKKEEEDTKKSKSKSK